MRWINYLRPVIKRGPFAPEEERTILQLHAILGNKYYTNCHNQSSCKMSHFPFLLVLILQCCFVCMFLQIVFYSSTVAWKNGQRGEEFLEHTSRMGLDPSTHAPTSEGRPQSSQSAKHMRHMSQWEIARLEAEARLSSSNKLNANDTNSNGKPPSDIFLKLWNSEGGKAFRRETDPQPTFSPVSSFCSACNSDPINGGQSFNDPNGANQKEHYHYSLEDHNSDDWIERGSCNAHKGHATNCNNTVNEKGSSNSIERANNGHDIQEHEISFSDLMLDFPDSTTTPNNNNSNPDISSIGCMITEFSTNFQQQSAWPWRELLLDEDKDCWNSV